ncbi:MAG: DUF4342 domain-containing protein [Clostridia bacterium]|nr:DUF4342 domain-containing protein [Clostridia bacterium]
MTNTTRSTLTNTRIRVRKGEESILNLSLLFSLIALLCAPWLVIIGVVAALALGYRISVDEPARRATPADGGATAREPQ